MNGLFSAKLMSTLMLFDKKPPLKDITYFNLHALS